MKKRKVAMSDTENVSIRKWLPEDEAYLVNFVQQEGWDFGMYEIRVYFKMDPAFLFVAVDNWNKPLGFIGIVKTTPDLYYVCSFIVREDLRGQGIGRKLWNVAMEIAGDTNMCLDGSESVVEWYMKNGFKLKTIHVRYDFHITLTEDMQKIVDTRKNIMPLVEDYWPSVMKYDSLIYPNFDREKILRARFTDEAVVVALVAIVDDVVCGFGSIHKQSDNVYALRNVFADDEDVLDAILRNMFKRLPTGCMVRFKLPDGKPIPKLLKSCDKPTGDTWCLYTKKVIDTNIDKIWIGPSLIV